MDKDKYCGITFVGNILADIVKRLDCYPQIGMLSNIHHVQVAVGGCVPNTAIDIKKIDKTVPVSAIGRVGNDEYGRFILSKMKETGIDTTGIIISNDHPTSFTDVMSLPNGERTFFHARAANSVLSPDDIKMDSLHCKILHIGYILLLDKFDAEDLEYGTVMARFLHKIQNLGIKTSIDVVSDSTADYKKKIIPALKYCDYAIMNEIESCSIYGLSPYKADGSLSVSNIQIAMGKMVESGVREKVLVHCKDAGFCLDAHTGKFTIVPSLMIPVSDMKGSVGAGDAFCAGSLYSIYKGCSDREILEFASEAAACNLFSENSVDGMRSYEEIKSLMKQYNRKMLEQGE